MTLRPGLLACITLAAALASTEARGQASANAVAAEALFREGRELMAQGQLAVACKKLEASEKLDPAVGTLFSLGECYEGQKRLASAWFAYREAVALAGRREDRRRTAAQKRAAELEPGLAHVVIRLPRATQPIEIFLDGDRILPDAVGTRLPVDPGVHHVEARSTTTWTDDVQVADGATTDVAVPPPPAPPTVHVPVARRAAGLALAAAGGAGLTTAALFGMQAIVKGRDANRACTAGSSCSDAAAVHEDGNAKTFADVSTVLFPVGAALVAAGGYLLLTSHVTLEPAVSPTTARMSLRLAW